ncbi:adenylate/guanylate cyclase domain-containing protein [Poritiphilus flavus]|uniref:Guanylate cyclase domain-containing protein n=1 Tax=Poritiphilus flavus TaxID=2697053 RepID=A0A6L9EBP8_9FLAO|nr:adenylate/guanylate cyclase domain-containing protein [Poritiphilus flavus]NAS12134.1 hypothetical protein [Poritiphilus flavus]
MKLKTKYRWRVILSYCIGWTLAFVFLSIVRGVGTMEMGQLKFDFLSSLTISFTMGPLIGLISGYSELLMEERIYKRVTIVKFLFFRLIYMLVFVLLMVLIAYATYDFYYGTDVSIWDFAVDRGSGAIYFYVITVDLFFSLLRQVNLMLGEGNLWRLVWGKFYTPKEEDRLFMFLDLRSSTTIAERLGHIKYSRLLQDCFNDISVVVENEAEIYQYVGDEAVLTWNAPKGLLRQNCLEAYFRFRERIRKREKYYLEQYDCVPFFKAGLHLGRVTVTEVGKYKKEIAYHGDTINTAARIQAQCNAFNEALLISEPLKIALPEGDFQYESLGKVHLKGKQKDVPVYAVRTGSDPQDQIAV